MAAKILKCSICDGPIENTYGWSKGHNAEPVNDGRCCGECNIAVVVPQRLKDAGLGLASIDAVKAALKFSADSVKFDESGVAYSDAEKNESR